MLITHAPGWLGWWFDSEAAFTSGYLLRGLLFTLSELFFAFKLLDVPWLRLPSDRRVWIVACLAITLLHARVAGQTVLGPESLADVRDAVLVCGGAALIAFGLVAGGFLPDNVRARSERDRARRAWGRILSAVRHARLPARFLLLARAGPIHRAPPR